MSEQGPIEDTPTEGARAETEFLALERKAFLALCKEEKSQARMEHMLMKNAPLRN